MSSLDTATDPVKHRANVRIALACLAFFASMIGLAYASVPLYELFCRVTGYGGTTQVSDTAPVRVLAAVATLVLAASCTPGGEVRPPSSTTLSPAAADPGELLEPPEDFVGAVEAIPRIVVLIEQLLDAGIDVYTTLNIQHVESLNDIVASFTPVRVREPVPDSVLEQAEIEIDDLTSGVSADQDYLRLYPPPTCNTSCRKPRRCAPATRGGSSVRSRNS